MRDVTDPWEFESLSMPEAPRDPSVDSTMSEPEEEGWPRGRDVVMAELLNRCSRLGAALRYMLDAKPEDGWRARSHAQQLLRDLADEQARRMNR